MSEKKRQNRKKRGSNSHKNSLLQQIKIRAGTLEVSLDLLQSEIRKNGNSEKNSGLKN
jgi:hypothetical protein